MKFLTISFTGKAFIWLSNIHAYPVFPHFVLHCRVTSRNYIREFILWRPQLQNIAFNAYYIVTLVLTTLWHTPWGKLEDTACDGWWLHITVATLRNIILWTTVNASQSSFTFYNLHYTAWQLHLSSCPLALIWRSFR